LFCFFGFLDIDKPKLFISPRNKVPENTDVTLHCFLESNPKVTHFTWYHNGRHISTLGNSDNTLKLYNVSPDSIGLYHCNVMFDNQIYVSDDAYIEVDCKLP